MISVADKHETPDQILVFTSYYIDLGIIQVAVIGIHWSSHMDS